MKVVGDRVVPETVAECADVLVQMAEGRNYIWQEGMPASYHALLDEWRAGMTTEEFMERDLRLLEPENVRALALAYGLAELAAVLRPAVRA